MRKKSAILILVIAVTVNLSNGYSIKQPDSFSGSFSGSSSSSSAYSHASSSSYNFNGNIDPNAVEGLKDVLKAGAVAGASAGAVAGAGSGALSGASAGSIAGAGTHGALSGASAGSIAGAGTHGALSGAGALAQAGAVSSSGSLGGFGGQAGAGATAGALGGHLGGTNTGSETVSGTSGSSGCSGDSACGSGQDVNAIGGSSEDVDSGAYKVIGSDKYTSGYTSGAKTNYAVSDNYVQGTQHAAGGCVSCKGQFPGPNGSINDYKLASSVPAVPNVVNVPIVQPVQSSGGSSGAHAVAGAGGSTSYQPVASVNNLPGSSGSIYNSKPAVGYNVPSINSGSHSTGFASGHVSPSLIATLPGPSGSIYDSKPANAGAVAAAGAAAVSGAQAGNGGSYYNVAPSHPVVVPSCSFTPGSPNKNCGATPNIVPGKPFSTGSGLSGIIPSLPGPSGSIYDSKPATSVPLIHGAGAVAGSGASSGSYNGAGSVANIPSTHPVVGPVCSYTPGSPNKCGSPVAQNGGQFNAIAGANANAAAQAGSGAKGPFPGPTGSIHDYKPATAVLSGGGVGNIGVGSGSSSSTGSGVSSGTYNGAGSISQQGGQTGVGSGANANANAAAHAGTGGSGVSSGTYNGAGSILQHGGQTGVGSGANANAAAHAVGGGSGISSGSYNGAGSVTNIPATHPVVGPACSYSPGSPNKCGVPVSQQGGQTGAGSGANANAASYAGAGGTVLAVPSIHPEAPSAPSVPSSGTYYINKPGLPSTDVQPPLVSSSPSFSGQIPCADSSCGSIQKTPSSVPVLQSGNCGSGSTCGSQAGSFGGSYAGSQGSSDSGIVYVDNDHSGQYQSINHDKSHLSGGIVYQNDDGSYDNSPTTGKSVYKNAQNGGHAVSSNNADNTGILIGPGTGHLPIEADAESKPFGTQGAFGGSAAFAKGAAVKNDKPFGTQGAFGESSAAAKGVAVTHDKPFGTQGAFGGSAAFAKSSASAQSSESQSQYGHGNGFATGDVTIQKSDGTQISPIDNIPGNNVAIGSGSDISSNSVSGSGYSNGQFNKNDGSPVKLQCTGASCGDTEVYVISEEPGSYGSQSGSGSSSNAGFATGQVLVNQGANTYDVTNSGANANALGGSYSGSQAGAYSGSSQFGSPGCITGQCGGQGFGVGGSFGIPSSGGFLGQLFGAGGLSGTLLNKLGGGGYGGSGAYSNAGSYAGASAGSYASAGASASAHAGSFASSF